MIRVDQFNIIRWKYVKEGHSLRRIARDMDLSRNTVKKYVDGLATPADKPTRVRSAAKIEAAMAAIEEYLESNTNGHTNKQRITVPTLLTEVNKFREKAQEPKLSRTTVQSAWAEVRRRQMEVFIPLVHRPGDEAQVDFFEVVACVKGVDRKAWMLLIRLVYSGLDYVHLYDHCDQVSLMHGHVEAFKAFGGVPARSVYDNLTPVVKKILFPGRVLNERFKNFAGHYAFECNFARPGEGHDKGAVESRGKGIRLQYATPIPHGDSLDEISEKIRQGIAIRQATSEADVAKACEEIDRLRPNPGNHFEYRKLVPVEVNSKSTFQFDKVTYSVPESWARLSGKILVGPFDLKFVCQQGEITLDRGLPGQKKIDYLHYLPQLARKPQAVRQVAPELFDGLGEPYRQIWELLKEAHGTLPAARVMAKFVAVIASGKQVELTQAIERILSDRTESTQETTPVPKTMEIPERLKAYKVTASSLQQFDELMRPAA